MPSHRPRAAGLQIGSARLTDRFATADPPTPSEVAAMRAAAADVLRAAPNAAPTELIAVGGTASNLVKVLPGVDRRPDADPGADREPSSRSSHSEPAAATASPVRHQSGPGAAPAGRWRDRRRPAGALRRERDPGLRGRPARGRRSSPSTTAGRPGATACPTWPTAGAPRRRTRRPAPPTAWRRPVRACAGT